MDKLEPPHFVCRTVPPPSTASFASRPIRRLPTARSTFRSCGFPLQGREGRFALKYSWSIGHTAMWVFVLGGLNVCYVANRRLSSDIGRLPLCADFCSLIPSLSVKLSEIVLARPTVLSAVDTVSTVNRHFD
jgi:hypothetical protein